MNKTIWAALAVSMGLAGAACAQPAPTGPQPKNDYTQDANWLCRPGRADACAQAHAYADAAHALGARAQVLPQDLSHQEINAQLGLDNAYTRQVEAFLRDISR